MPRKTGIISLVFAFLLLAPNKTLAYDDKTTHPALTDEIVDFYNLTHSGAPLSSEQKEWLVQGAMEEDTAPRWINHFYDPIRKVGWTGLNQGTISQSTAQTLLSIGFSTEKPLSAVEWVNSDWAQNMYESYGGNHTWNTAIDQYGKSDEQNAYISLGHVLHLLEDMGVPDHTRDDSHAPIALTGDDGSPLEDYGTQWTRSSLNIASAIQKSGVQPVKKSSIQEYLIDVAEYSNKYFFSKDTINDPKYVLPKIVRSDDNFGYGLDENGKEFPLARVTFDRNESNILTKQYIIDSQKVNYPILDAYFARSARKIIADGAGVIELFHKEGADRRTNQEGGFVIERMFHFANLTPTVSIVGFFSKIGDAIANGVNELLVSTGLTTSGGEEPTSESDPERLSALYGANIQSIINNVLPPPQPPQPPTSQPLPKKVQSIVPSPPPSPLVAKPEVLGDSISLPPTTVQSIESPPFDSAQGKPPQPSPPTLAFYGSGGAGPVFEPMPTNDPQPTADDNATTTEDQNNATTTDDSSDPPLEDPELAGGELVEPVEGQPPFLSAPGVPDSGHIVTFNRDTIELRFAWEPSVFADAENTSTIHYRIFQTDTDTSTSLSAGPPILVTETDETTFAFSIRDIGKDYTFGIEAFDDPQVGAGDGHISSSTNETLTVPSFLNDLFFYRLTNTDGDRDVLDLRYDSPPFIPKLDSAVAQGMVFYINREPNPANAILRNGIYGGGFGTQDSEGTLAQYLFRLSPRTVNFGPLGMATLSEITREDGRYVLDLPGDPATATYSPSDYVTVAYYSDVPSGGSDETFGLVALDHVKRYFTGSDHPPQLPPTSPTVSADFDPFHMETTFRWSDVTDPDSSSALFEINYGVAGESLPDAWTAMTPGTISKKIPVTFPNSYTFSVRAKDPDGNTSEPTILNWNFPDGFAPYLISGRLNSASQDFIARASGEAGTIKVFSDNYASWDSGGYYCGVLLYEIAEDGSQTLLEQVGGEPNGELGGALGNQCNMPTFDFATHPALIEGGHYRWTFKFENVRNTIQFYGRDTDTAGGPFSDTTIANALFTLKTTDGAILAEVQ